MAEDRGLKAGVGGCWKHMCWLLCLVGTVFGADIYVSPAGGGTGGMGDPTDLQSALALAQVNGENDIIYLQQGLYDASSAGADTYTYDTVGNDSMAVLVSGGWTTDFSSQADDPSLTVLDGGNDARVLEIYANVVGVDVEFTLEYVTIQNGTIRDDGDPGTVDYGGGIMALSGGVGEGTVYLTVRHCIFEANDAYNVQSDGLRGGAIYSACVLELLDCSFISNVAKYGGAVFTSTSNGDSMTSPLIEDCLFEDNQAIASGAAVFVYAAPTFIRCRFTGTLPTSGSTVGNTHADTSDMEFRDCFFFDNHAKYWGGAIDFNSTSGVITNTIFWNNSSGNSGDGGGGAITIYDGSPAVPNSVTLTNCTFVGNETRGSQGVGDAIYNRVQTLTLTNCIFWDNDGAHGAYNSGSATASFCNLQGGVSGGLINGGSNIDVAPDFVDAANGDFRLLNTSQCLDVGDNSAPGLPSMDMDGRSRIMDGLGNGTVIVDLGPYEYPGAYLMMLGLWGEAPEFYNVLDLIDSLFP